MSFTTRCARRCSIDEAARRLAPESPARLRWRRVVGAPLFALLVVVGAAAPLLVFVAALMILVLSLLLLSELAGALRGAGVAAAWATGELAWLVMAIVVDIAVVVGVLFGRSRLGDLAGFLAATPDDWRARCRAAARALVDRVGQGVHNGDVRVVVDIPHIDTWLELGPAYVTSSSSLREAARTWLSIDGDGPAFPLRVGVDVDVEGDVATIVEFFECRVPPSLARLDVWDADDDLPVHAVDPERQRVVFAVARSWRGKAGRHTTAWDNVGGTFPIEPLLRRLDEVRRRIATEDAVELARPQRLLADALPTAAAAAMLALSVAWVVGGGVLLLQAHAWVHASRGGASGPWAVLASLGVCFVLPAIVGVDCAARLRRRERRGWAIAMMLPVGAALLLSLELPWFVVAAALLPALLVVSPAVRWRMGIGPSSVIAEIEARKRVSLTKLAERHGVDRSALHHLLAWQVRVGCFHGALDVAGDEAISADTAANDAERQRCPGCGSAVRARGAVLRCGFCGTALVGSRRIEPPLPLPLSLELIAAALGLLALLAVGVGVVSTTILLEAGASGGALVAGVIVCAVLPVLWSLALRRAARGLVDGDNRARVLAGVVVPPVWLYLRQPLLRCLFGVGHQALEEQLARKGGCSLDDAARILGLRGGDVDTVVPFLVGRRWIAGVVDWHERRIVAAHFLAVDGRRRCNGCGSPLRVGGQCAWCGLVEEPRAPPAPPTPPSGSASVSAPTAS